MTALAEYRGKAGSVAQRVRTKLVGTAFPYLFRSDVQRTDLVKIGSDYGGWWVPATLFGPDSTCYAAGVGTDISFDLGLHHTFGCHVWGIDPTPGSIAWVNTQNVDEAAFTMVPLGLAGQPGTLRFYKPIDPTHISHSITNIQESDEWIDVECTTVAELMRASGHSDITLLKLDIEGAQHEVLDSIVRDGIFPRVLCVEFDQPESLSRTRRTVTMLRDAGYALVNVDWLNLTFVHI